MMEISNQVLCSTAAIGLWKFPKLDRGKAEREILTAANKDNPCTPSPYKVPPLFVPSEDTLVSNAH